MKDGKVIFVLDFHSYIVTLQSDVYFPFCSDILESSYV